MRRLLKSSIKRATLTKVTVVLLMFMLGLTGCVSKPPKNTDNICDIFREKGGWYKAAKRSQDKWGVRISINMAIMHQESRFKSRAKPPRKKILGFIPGPRPSSSYGYSQAKTATWDWYQDSAGEHRAVSYTHLTLPTTPYV